MVEMSNPNMSVGYEGGPAGEIQNDASKRADKVKEHLQKKLEAKKEMGKASK